MCVGSLSGKLQMPPAQKAEDQARRYIYIYIYMTCRSCCQRWTVKIHIIMRQWWWWWWWIILSPPPPPPHTIIRTFPSLMRTKGIYYYCAMRNLYDARYWCATTCPTQYIYIWRGTVMCISIHPSIQQYIYIYCWRERTTEYIYYFAIVVYMYMYIIYTHTQYPLLQNNTWPHLHPCSLLAPYIYIYASRVTRFWCHAQI
jgi:hypothetical protein